MAITLESLTSKSAGWLASIQADAEKGWGEYKGAPVNALNTAEAVLALLESGHSNAGDLNIQRAIEYLENVQLDRGASTAPSDQGAWAREIKSDSDITRVPDTIRSSFALLALNAAGKSPNTGSASKGIEWLERTQNEDGGWGYTSTGDSRLFPTCLSVRALLRMHHAGPVDLQQRLNVPINSALKLLHDTYGNANGSFGNQAGLVVSHTLHVINALKQARRQGFGFDPKDLEGAVDWISEHINEITQWNHETIQLGSNQTASANYTFTHVTPALYLHAFGRDLSTADEIANEALRVLQDSVDPNTGGFAAKRAVSWATAKSLLGLAAVDTVYQEIPERVITESKLQARHYTLLVMLAMAILATVLSLFEKLGAQEVGIFTLVITATLLVHGYISEKTFVDIILAKRAIKSRITQEKE